MTVACIFKEEMLDFLCDLEGIISGLRLTLNDDILEREIKMSPTRAPVS
jgi:hypothetical protein